MPLNPLYSTEFIMLKPQPPLQSHSVKNVTSRPPLHTLYNDKLILKGEMRVRDLSTHLALLHCCKHATEVVKSRLTFMDSD